MTRVDVAVVGAGLAGLYAAALLRARGAPCVVLESRDRVGGRALSLALNQDDRLANDPAGRFDLGPAWFWPTLQPRMPRLVADLGLVTFPQYSAGDILVERFGVGGPERYSPPAGAALESIRIRGGVAAMTDVLEGSLPSGTVFRGARVEQISLDGPSGVRLGLTKSDGLGQRTVTARCVILTAPPRVIARTISFDPPLPPNARRRLSVTPTWMAGHAKFLAVYERPFWREAGLSGTATSFVGPMAEIHDASLEQGRGALFGFLALRPAARQALGDRQLRADAIAQFGRLFGSRGLQPTAVFFKDWATDPDTATPDDLGPPADHPVYRNLALSEGPWLDRLLFAGTESADEHGGYLEGAIASAERAVAHAAPARGTAASGLQL